MSTFESEIAIMQMEPKEILEGEFMPDVNYLLDNNLMEKSELEKVIENRLLFSEKKRNNDLNREFYMARIREESRLVDILKFNIDNRLQAEEMQPGYITSMSILVNSVHYMYYSMLKIQPIQLSSLKDYIDFRFTNKSFINNETHLHQIIAVKHENPEVYKIVALSEYFKMNDIASARLCFSEGLKFHNNCKTLLSEEFNLEVQYNHDTNGESLSFALSKYEYVAKCFKGDLEFHFTLLDSVLRLNSVCELQYRVVSDMFEEYKQDERMWQKLAIVILNGYIFDYGLKRMHYNRYCHLRLSYSIKVFNDGLNENWSPEKRQILWNMFIDHMIEIWKANGVKNETITSNYVHQTMENVFQRALNEGYLQKAEHFAYWALYKNEYRHEIVTRAIEMNTRIGYIWMEILSVYIEARYSEMVKNVLGCAVVSLGSESLPLWQLVEDYIARHGFLFELFDFYQKAILGPHPTISVMFRPAFLKWFGLSYGISNTRKMFNILNELSPPCKQLYIDMIYYERTSGNFNKTQISKLYRKVCCTLGHGDVGLWANYIEFEYFYVDKYTAKNIYKSSLEYLGPDLFRILTTEFENIKREYYERNTRIVDPDIIDVDEAYT